MALRRFGRSFTPVLQDLLTALQSHISRYHALDDVPSCVLDSNLDQKYTTSWVMDDLQSHILHVTQVLLRKKIHPSHCIPTECKRHRCWSTAAGVHRLDHPPLASVCLNSCWLQSRQEFFGTRMDPELLPSA